jgi:nucleoid-associated protein YgaU
MPTPTIRSRLLNLDIVIDAGDREMFEIRHPLRRTRSSGVRSFVLTEGVSLHRLAFQVYGDAQLWWAIADFNDIFDPTTELDPGREILIPPIELVESYLSPGLL